MNILIVNGPNLNLLGEREPDVYGSETLADLEQWITEHDVTGYHQLKFYQSNHEGAILDFIQANRRWADAMVINAGALTHYSYALADCITGCQIRTIEVHISDIHAREEFRRFSTLEAVCLQQISGHGKLGYIEAIQLLTEHHESQ